MNRAVLAALVTSCPVWGAWAQDVCPGASTVVNTTQVGNCRLTTAGAQVAVATGGAINAADLNAVYVLSGGVGVTIENAGLLQSTGTGNVAGVNNRAGAITLLNNSGTIRSDRYGVWNQFSGTTAQLTNSGLIQGGNDGVRVTSGGIENLTNSGTIVGGDHGVHISGSGGQINVLTNASGASIRGTLSAISIFGSLSTLNNAGTIDGSVFTQDTTLNIQGGASRITGAVVNGGTGSVHVQSGAAFRTEGSFSSSRFDIASGGQLTVGASSHTLTVSQPSATAFNNAGTLVVDEGAVANIAGNYNQTGLVRIGASSNTSFGRVNVSGNAVVGSGATFDVDVNTANTLAAGQQLEGVVTASGTLTNNAPVGNVRDNSALFNFESSTNGNGQQIDLRILAAGTPPPPPPPPPAPGPAPAPAPAPTPTPAPAPAPESEIALTEVQPPDEGIVPALVQNDLLNGAQAAQVLDGFVRGAGAGSGWDDVVTALGRLPTNEAVAVAVGQIMPSLHGNAASVAMAQTASTASTLARQQGISGQACGVGAGDARPGSRAWVQPFGSWSNQDAREGASGYSSKTYGLMGGLQAGHCSGEVWGLGVGYLRGEVNGQDFASSHRNTSDSLQLVGYGRTLAGASGWRLGWQADYTRSQIETQRALIFAGRLAEADYAGDAWHLGVQASKPVVMGQTSVEPLLALDWRAFRSEGYLENGAGALNLAVASQTARALVVKAGVDVEHAWGNRHSVFAHGALGYDLDGARHSVTAQFTGGGDAFTTLGTPKARVLGELGLGLRLQTGSSTALAIRYDLDVRRGLRDQTASVRWFAVF